MAHHQNSGILLSPSFISILHVAELKNPLGVWKFHYFTQGRGRRGNQHQTEGLVLSLLQI